MKDYRRIASLSVSVLIAEETVVEDHWNGYEAEHREGYTRLYFIRGGRGRATVDGNLLEFGGGEVLLLPEGVPLRLCASPGLDHIWVHIQSCTPEGIPLFDLIRIREYRRRARESDRLYFTQMVDVARNEREPVLAEMKLSSLARLILLSFLDGAQFPDERGEGWLYEIMAELNERLGESVRIDELARRCGCHPTYLSNAFSRRYGMSPKTYLMRKRIETAQHHLWHSDKPLKEIAFLCGFGESYYFHRCFRKITGQTPGEYRRRRELYGYRNMVD